MLQLVTALIRDLQIEAFVFHCTIDMFAFVQEGKIFFVWAYHSTTDGYPAFNKIFHLLYLCIKHSFAPIRLILSLQTIIIS